MRLDIYVSNEKNCSRSYAKELILKGLVRINGHVAAKPAAEVSLENSVEITEEEIKFVSRGGLKLLKALQEFSIDINDKICLDVGASTGGFTDCMLRYGAKKVYAIDTGTGQLHESLRSNPKIISLEKTNINNLSYNDLMTYFDFAAVDVSFVSIKKILPSVSALLSDEACAVCLIKPQFEAGRGALNKKGIVRDEKIRKRVVDEIEQFAEDIGFCVMKTIQSPIEGGDGNIEYLMYMKKRWNT